MGKQLSFARGELSPSLYARTDLAMYAIGLRTCRNFFIAKQGGAYNRPGTTFINEVKDSTTKVRLIPFIFSDDDTYILEFGVGYIRFYRNGARVTVSGVSAWNSSTAYVQGDLCDIATVTYYCKVSHTNHVPPNTTYWYPLTGVIFEIPTSFTEDELSEFQYAQSNDVITIVHANHAPMELVRTAHTGWTLQNIVFGPSIAAPTGGVSTGGLVTTYVGEVVWYLSAVDSKGEESLRSSVIHPYISTVRPGSATPINLTWNAVTGASYYKIYRQVNGANEASPFLTDGLIGETTQTHFKDIAQEATIETPLSSIDSPCDGLNPNCVFFSQNRLIFGNTSGDPSLISASRLGSYKNFQKKFPIEDDSPVSFSLSSKRANIIRHILESRQLVVLTSSGEWAINGDAAGILTVDSINAKQYSYNGSDSYPSPLNINDTILYVQDGGSIIRDLGFNFQSDGYGGNDLTILSVHLFEGKTIVDWGFAQTPNSILWVVLDDGTFLSLTYIKEQEMLAWTRHDTDGLVENVAVIPDGNEDRVYFVVKRTIDGEDVRYIEKMETRVIADIEDAIFMDSTVTLDGSPVTSVPGLTHLEGKEVAIFADGFVIASPNNPEYKVKTVVDGSVALGGSYSVVHVGLSYLSDLQTLDIDNYAGEKKIITQVRSFVEKSRGFFAGASDPGETTPLDGLTETKLRTTEAYDEPIELKTEEIDLNIRGEWSKGGRIFIRNPDPLPLAILSIVPGGFMPHG